MERIPFVRSMVSLAAQCHASGSFIPPVSFSLGVYAPPNSVNAVAGPTRYPALLLLKRI